MNIFMVIFMALVLTIPINAYCETSKLNVKDSSGTEKFSVSDIGNVKFSGSLYKGYNMTLLSGFSPDLQIVREDTNPRILLRDVMTSSNGGPALNFMHNNGTEAARLPASNGDILGKITFGHINSGNDITNGIQILGIATENFTDTSSGSKLIFRTVPNGTTTMTDRMVVDSTGNVGIGAAAPTQMLEVNGGVRLNASVAKPACDSSSGGTFWFTNDALNDTLEICAKKAGVYAWRAVTL